MRLFSQDPYTATVPDVAAAQPWQVRVSTIVEAIVVLCILAILIALLWESSLYCGDGRRTQCRNNLKQIGLGLHNYHEVYGSFPPAMICADSGRPMHSWRVLILPFVEQKELYDQYDFDEPWNGPHNITLQDRIPHIYQCPSFLYDEDREPLEQEHLSRLSSYAAITHSSGIFDGTTACEFSAIKDDPGSTLAASEVCQHAVHWMSPDDVTPDQFLTDLRRSVHDEHGNHKPGLQVLLSDGSVRYLSHDTDESRLNDMMTINGGEDVVLEW